MLQSYACPIDTAMQVWLESAIWVADKAHCYILSHVVTLKVGSVSQEHKSFTN